MIRKWITLLRLARRRFHGEAHYREFQAYQGSLVLDYLAEQGVGVENALALDLGCGNGGYSDAMAREGAQVVSVDLHRPKIPLANFIVADAIQLPLGAGSFSLVFCASLIEHIAEPSRLLAQIRHVLAPGGFVYLSFPPFYSPVGGHQFKPYHLLGERWALCLSGCKADGFATACGDWGLYPLTVRRARQLFSEAGLRIVHESTRFLPFNLTRLPWLGEFLTWHVQFILVKNE